MLNSHGENTRTWPHSRMLAPTASPASKTSGSRPRASSCAAAARPTGPAPITATGRGSCGSWQRSCRASKNFDALRDRSELPRRSSFFDMLLRMTSLPARPVLRPARRAAALSEDEVARARARLQGAGRPPPRQDPQPPARRRRRSRLRVRLRGPARPQAVDRQLPPQAAARRRHRRAREARLVRLLQARPRRARACAAACSCSLPSPGCGLSAQLAARSGSEHGARSIRQARGGLRSPERGWSCHRAGAGRDRRLQPHAHVMRRTHWTVSKVSSPRDRFRRSSTPSCIAGSQPGAAQAHQATPAPRTTPPLSASAGSIPSSIRRWWICSGRSSPMTYPILLVLSAAARRRRSASSTPSVPQIADTASARRR